MKQVSGLYHGSFFSKYKDHLKKSIDLRVDIDGERPLNIISGDISSIAGERVFLESFKFRVKKKEITQGEIKITGADGEFQSGILPFEKIEITLPHTDCTQASVKMFNSAETLNFICERKSDYFRSVSIVHDCEEGVERFDFYAPLDLIVSPGLIHTISLAGAFAKAGIQLIIKEKQQTIPHPESEVWTYRELMKAMLTHFSYTEDASQWSIWLLSAQEYVFCTLQGTIITKHGDMRTGCAVFENATGWSTPEEKRRRFFIYMHELGHCFNLRHPWDPSQSNAGGYSTLSWMNYPWKYHLSNEVYGSEDFWKVFNLQFSNAELMHLRHSFKNVFLYV